MMPVIAPLLVAIDPVRPSPEAVELAADLHGATGAPLVLASVTGYEPGWFSDGEHAVLTRLAEEALDAAEVVLGDRAPASRRVLELPDAAPALRHLADDLGAIALVAGPGHRTSVARATVGGVVERLKADVICPVAVAPHDFAARGALRAVGVAVAPLDAAPALVQGARGLAERLGASLEVVTVPEGAVHELAAATARLDLLVCGPRRHGPLTATLLGSVTRRLLGRAHCPVLLVPRGAEERLASFTEPTPQDGAAA